MYEILAEITGTVFKIDAVSGQAVELGEVILHLESMKMEFAVESPVAGICSIIVSEGQPVQEGDLLARVEYSSVPGPG